MSRLFLICGLCGRQQADGLLSRGYWGHLEITSERTLRACPTCKEQHGDWEERLRSFPKTGLREYGFDDTPMPSYRKKLSAQQIADLVSYLVSLQGVPTP